MAVLPLEQFVFPAELFSSSESVSESVEVDGGEEPRWWVLQTRSRGEKSLARRLLQCGVSFFLPLHERRKRIQRRLVRSHLPLFPGYLFFRGSEESRREALETNLVVNCLHVEEQHRFANDMARIFELVTSGAALSPEERLTPGMAAEITSGPLAGRRGKILRCGHGRTLKFVVAVDFLQQGVSVEVDDSMIRAV